MTDRELIRDPRDIEEDRLAREQAALDPDMQLLTSYLDGELPADERVTVERRLEHDPEFYRLAYPLLLIAKVPPQTEPMSQRELEGAWLRLRQRIGLPEVPGHPVPEGAGASRPAVEWRRRTNNVTRRRILMGIAAVILLMFGVPMAGIWYELTFNHQNFETAANTSTTLSLPDGSRARLAGGSKVHFRHDLATRPRRAVWLDGEATFDVVRSDKPFTVHARGAEITVLGTEFTIHGYGNEPVVVTVTRGSVRVQSFDDLDEPVGDPVTLVAGQRARAGINMRAEIIP